MSHVATARLSRQAAAFLERVALILRDGGEREVSCADGTRIPTSFLSGDAASGAAGAGWRIQGGDERLALALALLGLEARFGVARRESHRTFLADQPFRAMLGLDGALALQPEVGAAGNPRLESTFAHSWIGALEPPKVTFDLVNVTHLNSILIAWMLQVAQGARPAPVCIANASPGVSAQLRQLRLDHLMALI